jgi:Ni,Fe-hydrogenase III small subunit
LLEIRKNTALVGAKLLDAYDDIYTIFLSYQPPDADVLVIFGSGTDTADDLR